MRRLFSFLTAAVLGLLFSEVAMAAAEGAAGAAGAGADSNAKVAIALASGLAIAIGAFGAALAQGRMAAAAMESIGRNPNSADRIQLPMILGLAFIEALALYAFVIAFFLQGKI